MPGGLETATLVPYLVAMAATGVLAGTLAGLLGIGGGIVVVPVLFHVLGLFEVAEAVRMHVAVGSSLAIIVPTAFMSARSHYRRDAVDMALVRQWAPFVVLGVALGAALAAAVVSAVLSLVFGGVALLVAARMAGFFGHQALRASLPARPISAAIATVIGGISTLMGIGGGTLSVSVLTLCSYDIRRAVGTASAIGLVIALPAALGFVLAGLGVDGRPALSLGYVNVLAFALIFPLTASLAPLGARLAHRVPRQRLRAVFAFFLAIVAVKLIADGYAQL